MVRLYRYFELPEDVREILEEVVGIVNPAETPWYLAGSASMVIRGAEIEIGDLDLINCGDSDLFTIFMREVPERFKEHNSKKNCDTYVFGQRDVEIYPSDGMDFNELDRIYFEGNPHISEIRLCPLERLLELYKQFNRPEKIQLVEKLMKERESVEKYNEN